jgi:uncharacterized protein (TIGR02145 family)
MKNLIGTLFFILFVFVMSISCKEDCIDIDGNVYSTVKIGNQTWMAENLQTTKYRNGDPISNIVCKTDWKNKTTGAYCNFDNTVNTVYGKLYNWYAVSDSRNIAPQGWHVPTDIEWSVLETFLGGNSRAGGILKEIGIMHWRSPNSCATNESGFTGLPAGFRNGFDGRFDSLGITSYFWSFTQDGTSNALNFNLLYNSGSSCRASFDKSYGVSVRCVKD